MPTRDRVKQQEAWNRWYQANKAKHHERVRATEKKRRDKVRQLVREYKGDRGCSRCPEHRPACLDFHHVGDDKEFNVADALRNGYGIPRIMAEIAKCEVICANCHRVQHANAEDS